MSLYKYLILLLAIIFCGFKRQKDISAINNIRIGENQQFQTSAPHSSYSKKVTKDNLEDEDEDPEELYGFLTQPRKDYAIFVSYFKLFNGLEYCVLSMPGEQQNSLWCIDKNNATHKILNYKDYPVLEKQAKSELKFGESMDYANSTRGVVTLESVNDNLYFTYSNGCASKRLYKYNAQGCKVIDGITDIHSITNCQNRLVFAGTNDDDTKGLFTVGINYKPELLIESTPSDCPYIIEGFPYGRFHKFPVIDSLVFIKVGGKPYLITPQGKVRSYNLPEKLCIDNMAQVDNGLWMNTSSKFRSNDFVSDCVILDNKLNLKCTGIYDRAIAGFNPIAVKSIDKTAYFEAQTDSVQTKIFFFKDSLNYGDLTEKFNNHHIKVTDLVNSYNGLLIVSKHLELEDGPVYILQSYDVKADELKIITSKGKPMEIYPNQVSFKYNDKLYFVGGDAESKNCLWCYDGEQDPQIVKIEE